MKKVVGVWVGLVAFIVAAGPASAWTIIQNFDDLADGASCGWDAGTGSTVSSAMAYSGSKSCRLTINQGDTGFGMWGGIINHPSNVGRGGEIWLRVRTFMPAGFNYNSNGEGDHLKFFRFHTMSNSNSNFGYDDWYINPQGTNPPFLFIYEGEQIWDNIGTPQDAIVLGTWETYEYYVHLDTVPAGSGGLARVRTWKNGLLIAELNDRITLETTDGYSDRTHLFTYWNGGSPATQAMYVDDVELTTDTPAARDANGNPFIGMGGGAPPPVPMPPVLLRVQ
jgi:hypothetical protein